MFPLTNKEPYIKSSGERTTLGDMFAQAGGDISELEQEVDALKEALTDEAETRAALGAKNLLSQNPLTTFTENGVTITGNADGSITVYTEAGGATARVSNVLHDFVVNGNVKDTSLNGKRVILSGCPTGGSSSTYYMQFFRYDGSTTAYDYGEGTGPLDVNVGTTGYVNITMRVESGTVITTPIIFKPMLRLATDADETYRPYVPTNAQLLSHKDNGVLGAKNLIPYPFQDTRTTIQGITYIDNGDGTLTVNGTATATSYFNLTDKDFGEITFSSLSPISNSKYIATLEGGSNTVLLTYNKGNKLTSIQINKDTVVSNLVLKPMIRLATDSDPTFQPYAMTNKELTDAVAENKVTLSLSTGYSVESSSSIIVKNGICYFNPRMYGASSFSDTTKVTVATLPSNCRPKANVIIPSYDDSAQFLGVFNIQSNGDIEYKPSDVSRYFGYVNASFPIG